MGNNIVANWDEHGILSIVVQGGIFQGNLIEVANHCRHWRELFPAAEIILVISVTDIIVGEVKDGVFSSIQLVSARQHDGQLQAAAATLQEVCDKIALSEHALPLPPIKSDSAKLNNMNLQLAAAQHGLALAGGLFVLRVRNDLIFLDRNFIDQYYAAEAVPRGKAATFTKRVLISWLFTLNPFTNERLPLHFSDWFHFGLTKDVRRIWAAPHITLRDSLHYRTHRHAPGSNAAERLFNVRLAVEQHIIYHCFKTDFPNLVLNYHNDRSSVNLAMRILIDNFAICDLEQANCVFEKYSNEFAEPAKKIQCITQEDWFALTRSSDGNLQSVLASKIDEFSDSPSIQLKRKLPRTYDATRLQTRDGRLLNHEIVAQSRGGMLFWGPYTTLDAGRYLATVDVTTLDGAGVVILRVTMNSGRDLLAERILAIRSGRRPDLAIPFDVSVSKASELEVICRFEGLRGFAISGITFSERSKDEMPAPRHQQEMPRTFNAASLSTRDGRLTEGAIVAASTDGVLFYGPYATIAPGRYLARVDATALEGPGSLTLRVTLDSGNTALAEKTFILGNGTLPKLEIAFDIPGDEAVKLEVVCNIKGVRRVAVSSLVISARVMELASPPRARSLLRLFR